MKRKKLIVRHKLKRKFKTIEEAFLHITSANRNMYVPWYLLTSYLYYHRYKSSISDQSYDLLCRKLSLNWNRISHHHKYLIDRESLSAGTGYSLSEKDYPLRVIGAALQLDADLISY